MSQESVVVVSDEDVEVVGVKPVTYDVLSESDDDDVIVVDKHVTHNMLRL